MKRYAFQPQHQAPDQPEATEVGEQLTTIVTPGALELSAIRGERSSQAASIPHPPPTSTQRRSTRPGQGPRPATLFTTPMTDRILHRIPIAMNLDEDNNAEDKAALETELIDNRMPTQSIRTPRTASKGHPVRESTNFTWDEHLNHETFSQWLIQHIILDMYHSATQYVFSIMDNIHTFDQLVYNFEYFTPKALLDWFPSSLHCKENLDGLICLILLPDIIQSAKTTIPEPDVDKYVSFVRSMLTSRMNGAHYQQLRTLFLGILSKTTLLDTTYKPSPPKYTEQSDSLTPSEVEKFYNTLDELHEDYPEVDVTASLQRSIRRKIIAERPPKTVSVPSCC